MTWRPARSLPVLRDQIDAAYPGRDKGADGILGDTAHASRASDHNPDSAGVVHAIDIDRDLGGGHDAHEIAVALVASRDPRIKYIISQGRIIYGTAAFASAYGDRGVGAWVWTKYYGGDQHYDHFHLSVVPDSRCDQTTPWKIGAVSTVKDWSDMATKEEVRAQCKAACVEAIDARMAWWGPRLAALIRNGNENQGFTRKNAGGMIDGKGVDGEIADAITKLLAAEQPGGAVDVNAIADRVVAQMGSRLGRAA